MHTIKIKCVATPKNIVMARLFQVGVVIVSVYAVPLSVSDMAYILRSIYILRYDM